MKKLYSFFICVAAALSDNAGFQNTCPMNSDERPLKYKESYLNEFFNMEEYCVNDKHIITAELEKSVEIGIIVIPDDKTQAVAKMLQDKSLNKLVNAGIIDQSSYEESYPNYYHISLYQLKILEKNLLQFYQEMTLIGQNTPALSFKMNDSLQDTQQHIFWTSDEAKSFSPLTKLHERVVNEARKYRDQSEAFSQVKKISPNELTVVQKQYIKEFGIFWGLPINFNPHITLIYNSGKDTKEVSIKHCIKDVNPPRFHQFYAKAIAIGKLGPGGNVVNILATIKLLELPTTLREEGIFKSSQNSRTRGKDDFTPSKVSKL